MEPVSTSGLSPTLKKFKIMINIKIDVTRMLKVDIFLIFMGAAILKFLAVNFQWPRGGFPAYLGLATHNLGFKTSSDNNIHFQIKNSGFKSPGACRNVASKLVDVSSSEKSTCRSRMRTLSIL